jgi:acyl carrier protein
MDIRAEIKTYVVDNILFGDCTKLGDDVSFQKSGILDSTGFLELINFVEEKYGIEVSDSELVPENFDTLSKMSSFVDQKRRGNTSA